MINYKYVKNLILFAIFIIIFLFFCKDLEFSKMWAFGDLIAFPTNIGVIKNWCFYVWKQEGMGYAPLKSFTYYLVIFVSSFIFGGILAQKIIYLSTFIISFLTFSFFLRKFNIRSITSFIGALTYAFNPITISSFIGGSAFLVFYSIFPLFFILIIKIIQHQKIKLKYILILGSLGFFIFNLHAAFWYFIVVVPLILFEMYPLIKGLKKIVRLTIPLAIIILILLPSILGYIGMYGISARGNATYEGDAKYCYEDSTFYNIVRLAGNKGSAQAKQFLNYNTLNSYTFLGYTLPIVAFFSFLDVRKQEKNKKILSMTATISSLIFFGIIILIKTLPYIVDLNPIFASLRNPSKLMNPLSFSLCLLFTLGIENLFKLFKKYNFKINMIISLILTIIIIIYNYPALDGTMGLRKTRADSYYNGNKYYNIAGILEEIDQNYTDYRVLFLPWERSKLLTIESKVSNYFGVDIGRETYLDRSWIKNIFEAIVVGNSIDRSYLLSLFGVKYIVLDNNFTTQSWYLKNDKSYVVYFSYGSFYVDGNPAYFYNIFNIDSNFDLVYKDQEFVIFRNKKVIPKIYTRPNVMNLNLSHTSKNLLLNPSFENNTEYWKTWPSNLVSIKEEFIDKDKFIILYGQEKCWTNCYQTIFVNENALYGLKFSVKAYNITDMHAKIYWYNITENLNEGNSFSINYIKLNEIVLDDGRWYNIEKVFSAPKGAKMAIIQFLGNRFHNFTNTSVYIDNVFFYEDKIVMNKNEVFSSMTPIYYKKINPTKYFVKTNATTPFIIAFTEMYNPSWVAYFDGEKVSSVPLYDIINGFWIRKRGELEITIEYKPQNKFHQASVISIITIIISASGGLALLIWECKDGGKKNQRN